MLKALLKKQLLELNRSFFQNSKTGKVRSAFASIAYIILFALLMIVFIGGIFYVAAKMLSPLITMEKSWLYFCLMGMVAFILGIFGSVFNTYSSLYNAKDNDLLLSMPIPVSCIIFVRLTGVYLMGLLYSGVVIVPAVIVFYQTATMQISNIICPILFALLLSFLVLILSCILGWVVAKISAKLKNKSLITVLVSLIFLAVYYYIYFKASESITLIIENSDRIATQIKNFGYPLYLMGKAAIGDIPSMAIFAAAMLILFLLVYRILSRSFLKIALEPEKTAKTPYKARKQKPKSIRAALLGREMSRFLSSPVYILNCSLGTLLLIISSVAVLIKGEWIRNLCTMLELPQSVLPPIAIVSICLLASMNNITAPTISMEGKSLWLIQSLPVSTWKVFKAKLSLHILLTAIPALLCSLCMAIVIRPTLTNMIFLFLLPLAVCIFSAETGLIINLKRPNLNWTSEAAAVKQGIGIFLAFLLNWAYIIALGFALVFDYQANNHLYIILCSVLTVVLDILLGLWLKSRGTKRFEEL